MMGDRISISFYNYDRESVVLFSHWDGMELVSKVEEYIEELNNAIEKELRKNGLSNIWKLNGPLSRLEPETVMVDFIRWLLTGIERVTGNYYLGVDKYDGDNDDNGHWIFNLKKGGWWV